MYKIKLDNGKYKFVESYKGLNGKRRRVTITKENQTRATEKQAYEELQAKINKILSTKIEYKELGYYIDEFLDYKKNTVSKNTYTHYKRSLKFLDRTINIKKINKKDIEKHLILLKEKYKPQSIKSSTIVINTLFKFIKEYYIPEFEMNVKFTLTKEDKQEILQKVKYIETNRISKVLSQITHEKTKDFVTVQLLTGLRAGELLALTIKDIDIDNKTLTVSKTRQIDGSITAPKTLTSNRTIEINDEVLEIIARNVSNKTYIFPITITSINKHLNKFNLSTHIFRHTHVALLIEAGIPIKVISERLGHSDTNTTLSIYTHVTENMKLDLRKKLDNLGTF